MFSQELQADAKGQRALRWNETFAFLAGGNVAASEALELQLKQTVGQLLCFAWVPYMYVYSDDRLTTLFFKKSAAAHLPHHRHLQDPLGSCHWHGGVCDHDMEP